MRINDDKIHLIFFLLCLVQLMLTAFKRKYTVCSLVNYLQPLWKKGINTALSFLKSLFSFLKIFFIDNEMKTAGENVKQVVITMIMMQRRQRGQVWAVGGVALHYGFCDNKLCLFLFPDPMGSDITPKSVCTLLFKEKKSSLNPWLRSFLPFPACGGKGRGKKKQNNGGLLGSLLAAQFVAVTQTMGAQNKSGKDTPCGVSLFGRSASPG